VRDVDGAAEAVSRVVETSGPGDDDRTTEPSGVPGLAHAPQGLATATEAPAASAFPVLAPPGACRYLQLDGVRQASCHALDPAIRLASRQVELVCLGAGHTDCPRFTRAGGDAPLPAASAEARPPVHDLDPARDPATASDASAVTGLPPAAPVEVPSVRLGHTVGSLQLTPQAHRSRWPRPAMVVATGVLAAAIVFAIGFAALRGGLDRSLGQAPAASVSVTASPAPPGSGGPGTSSEASAGPTTASPSAGVAAASATPSIPSPRTSPSAAPSPDRMALLTPCPDQPDCYQYRIHRHDNLRGIAAFFGVPYQTVLDLNPQIKNPSLIHVGQIIILPPPGP
jgi:hypothetical protein